MVGASFLAYAKMCIRDRDYACYSQELMSLKRQYEENFGPLQNFGNSIIGSTFTWVDDPWPWENKEV